MIGVEIGGGGGCKYPVESFKTGGRAFFVDFGVFCFFVEMLFRGCVGFLVLVRKITLYLYSLKM